MNSPDYWRWALRFLAAILTSTLLVLSGSATLHAAEDKPVDPHAVPVIDGGIGPCSMEFTIQERSGKPVYAAKVRVHIAYGFAGTRKLDLEVGTNVDGKARFEGLPNRVKRPLRYEASEGDREGSAFYDPADSCKAQHVMVIAKGEGNSNQP